MAMIFGYGFLGIAIVLGIALTLFLAIFAISNIFRSKKLSWPWKIAWTIAVIVLAWNSLLGRYAAVVFANVMGEYQLKSLCKKGYFVSITQPASGIKSFSVEVNGEKELVTRSIASGLVAERNDSSPLWHKPYAHIWFSGEPEAKKETYQASVEVRNVTKLPDKYSVMSIRITIINKSENKIIGNYQDFELHNGSFAEATCGTLAGRYQPWDADKAAYDFLLKTLIPFNDK